MKECMRQTINKIYERGISYLSQFWGLYTMAPEGRFTGEYETIGTAEITDEDIKRVELANKKMNDLLSKFDEGCPTSAPAR